MGFNAGNNKEFTPALSAFGDQAVEGLTPQVQLKFNYNINSEILKTAINNAAGSIGITDNKGVVATGAASNSLAVLYSRKAVEYHAAQGVIARFSAIFTKGIDGSTQHIGMGAQGDGLFFGYQGDAFGVIKRSAGAPHIEEFTVTNGATVAGGNITITLDGDDKVIAITNGDDEEAVARKIAATDFSQVGDGWDVFIAGAIVEFTSYKTGPRAGSFTFTDTGTTGVTITNTTILEGVDITNIFIDQSDWSGDLLDGTGKNSFDLDPTKGNVYEIQYQWLGFGGIKFYVEDPKIGDFVLVHTIEYSNANILPSINNPALPLCIEVENTTNDTNVQIQSSSMGGFTEGSQNGKGLPHTEDSTKSLSTTETVILAIHNKPVFQGVQNRTLVKPRVLSLGADGNKLASFKVYINPIIGGNPSFADHDSDVSVISVDTTGTTITGGNEVFSAQVGKTGDKEIDLGLIEPELYPGDTIAVTGVFFTAGSGDLSVGLTWTEGL
ncbi:hypothetical protein KAR91_40990 [Candidatus Pacearchaeota archaeon]|nr:hypothetical protein [Candidatus Pacearchaeota archaeon]